MENIVERIVEICKAKGIPVSKLEKDLGYGNGFESHHRHQFIRVFDLPINHGLFLILLVVCHFFTFHIFAVFVTF